MPERTAVNLPADKNPDGSTFYESVLVDDLGGGRYRVVASPGLTEGIAAGDEIELAPGDPRGFTIVKRGGNIAIQFFLEGDLGACAADLTPRFEALGGWLDGERSTLLVFTVPASAGFPAIERVLRAAEHRYAGARWMYGNVYEASDGVTPLGWWE